MTIKYQNEVVAGDAWLRANRIVVENPLYEIPKIRFVEEKVLEMENGDIHHREMGYLEVKGTPEVAEMKIPIIDPTTGEPTGELINYHHFNTILASMYLFFANLRDNPPEVEGGDSEEGGEESGEEV